MLMRDTMHQKELGVIISFFKAILRKYLECVETHPNIPGRAARKLTHQLQMMMKKYTTSTGHTMSGKHNCLLPVTYAASFVFLQLLDKNKTFRHLRATVSQALITDTFFWYCHSYGTTCSAMKWRITIANANTANPKSLTLLQSLLQLQTLFCRGTSFFVASLLQRL